MTRAACVALVSHWCYSCSTSVALESGTHVIKQTRSTRLNVGKYLHFKNFQSLRRNS